MDTWPRVQNIGILNIKPDFESQYVKVGDFLIMSKKMRPAYSNRKELSKTIRQVDPSFATEICTEANNSYGSTVSQVFVTRALSVLALFDY